MRPASTFTIRRGTATGSETVEYVAASASDDRVKSARVIADMLSALEHENIKHGWTVEYARIRAEMLLEEWGFARLPAIVKVPV